jgi:hypothetical protein
MGKALIYAMIAILIAGIAYAVWRARRCGDCPPGQVCVDGKCVAAAGCRSGLDCTPPAVCVNGQCQTPGSHPITPLPPPPITPYPAPPITPYPAPPITPLPAPPITPYPAPPVTPLPPPPVTPLPGPPVALGCGAAGVPCALPAVCVAGKCVVPFPPVPGCGNGPACTPPDVCDYGICVPPRGCGSGPLCVPPATCVNGACVAPAGPKCGAGPACVPPAACVNGACASCGAGPPCALPRACIGGVCGYPQGACYGWVELPLVPAVPANAAGTKQPMSIKLNMPAIGVAPDGSWHAGAAYLPWPLPANWTADQWLGSFYGWLLQPGYNYLTPNTSTPVKLYYLAAKAGCSLIPPTTANPAAAVMANGVAVCLDASQDPEGGSLYPYRPTAGCYPGTSLIAA